MNRNGRPAAGTRILAGLRTDAGGAALLVAATLAALVWANLPLTFGYADFWSTEVTVDVGGAALHLDLHELVNEGLMTFFFFVVGLEVKRDLVLGELADRRRRAVPLLAAIAGMALPAIIYLAITWGTAARGGWGVVISTDTAFLLGALALLGRACPPQLRVLLMALAVADDVAALTVIALFYTDGLRVGYLLAALAGIGLMFLLRRFNVWRGPIYLVVGVAAWIALYLSGVEPTLLGVAVAFATETYATRRDHVAAAAARTRAYLQSPDPELAHSAGISLQRAVPVNERLLRLWQPWSTVVIVPLFALANAGIPLSTDQLSHAMRSPVALGVVAGLVGGKMLGIFAGAELAVRLRVGRLAPGLTRLHLLGGAALAGMGFTISLFIVDLAFPAQETADAARTGILVASLLAAAFGTVLLRYAARRSPPGTTPDRLEPPVDVTYDHVRGPLDAPLTLVEYGDYESPESHGAHLAVQEVHRRLPGEVRFVFRHLPNTPASPNTQLAAEAVEAAGAQGQFWPMHDRLFDTSPDPAGDPLSLDDLFAKAATIGLDQAAFAADLGAGRFARRIQQDANSARASGANRSPTFFVGEDRYDGPHDADSLIEALTTRVPGTGRAAAPRTRTSGVLPPWQRGSSQAAGDFDAVPRDTAETPDHDGILPRLTDPQLRLLADEGQAENTHERQVLFDVGQRMDDLLVICSGAVAIVEYAPHGSPEISVHEGGRFLGEVDLLTDQTSTRAAVVIRPGVLLRLSPQQQHSAFRRDAGLRELVTRTALLRRAGILAEVPDLRVVGTPGSDATGALTEWADAHGRTIAVDDVSTLPADAGLGGSGLHPGDLPLVFTRSGALLKNPGPEELARAFPDRPQ